MYIYPQQYFEKHDRNNKWQQKRTCACVKFEWHTITRIPCKDPRLEIFTL